jgi:hypothetical protein
MRSILLIAFLFWLSACSSGDTQQVDEGMITNGVYESNEIGWKIKIPDGWRIVSKKQTDAANEKGKKLLESTVGGEISVDSLKQLISFQKDQFNLFTSSCEPFKEEYEGEFIENGKMLNGIVYDAFVSQGIRADSASGRQLVQDLEFQTFETTIYAKDGKVILNQLEFSRLINGYAFTALINYNNSKDKETMLKAFQNSSFSKQ